MVNLMTPFRDNGHLDPSYCRYNQKLSSVRSVIEIAFGTYKFRRLKYLDIAEVEAGNTKIAAACMLHNFIIDCGELIEEYATNTKNDEELEEDNTNLTPTKQAEQKRVQIVNLLLEALFY